MATIDGCAVCGEVRVVGDGRRHLECRRVAALERLAVCAEYFVDTCENALGIPVAVFQDAHEFVRVQTSPDNGEP